MGALHASLSLGVLSADGSQPRVRTVCPYVWELHRDGGPSCESLLLASGNKPRWDLMLHPAVMLPVMQVWPGKKCDCGDLTSDLITPSAANLPVASGSFSSLLPGHSLKHWNDLALGGHTHFCLCLKLVLSLDQK